MGGRRKLRSLRLGVRSHSAGGGKEEEGGVGGWVGGKEEEGKHRSEEEGDEKGRVGVGWVGRRKGLLTSSCPLPPLPSPSPPSSASNHLPPSTPRLMGGRVGGRSGSPAAPDLASIFVSTYNCGSLTPTELEVRWVGGWVHVLFFHASFLVAVLSSSSHSPTHPPTHPLHTGGKAHSSMDTARSRPIYSRRARA